MIWSARLRTALGTRTPSARAAFRLTTSRNRVHSSTGRVAGVAPFNSHVNAFACLDRRAAVGDITKEMAP